MERTKVRTRLIPSLRLATAIGITVALVGCAATGGSAPGEHVPPVPQAYQGWFGGVIDADISGRDWDTIDYSQRLIEEERYEEALEHLDALMARNIMPAFYEVGKLYERGIGVEENPAKAAELYGKALDLQSPIHGNASLNLGRLYQEGRGVERNDVLAYHLLWQAMEEGVEQDAETRLAEMLANGTENIKADPDMAKRLLERAASRGDAKALEALAKAHSPGGWLEEDPALAMDYAQRFAETLEAKASQGDTGAMLQLASMYSAEGLLGDQPEQRIRWMRQAAAAGDIDALARTGRQMIDAGESARGLELLAEAAGEGHVDAMTYYGEALLEGTAGQPQPVQAERWLREAIEAGS
ncbi:MAG: sel1 repeat family protein, partial [Halomonas sp.]|nr:sel1 repeat family protein [Halomonas sp.]